MHCKHLLNLNECSLCKNGRSKLSKQPINDFFTSMVPDLYQVFTGKFPDELKGEDDVECAEVSSLRIIDGL